MPLPAIGLRLAFRFGEYNRSSQREKLQLAAGTKVEFSSRQLADVAVVAPVGQIDHCNAQKLQQALTPMLDQAAAAGTPVVLDFTGVEYISSMGLRVLMVAAKQMRGAGVRIAVAALQPVVQEIFDIARFKHVMEVFPSVRSALHDLSAPALSAYDAAQ